MRALKLKFSLQVRMVKIFHEIFGNKLVEESAIKEKSINQLPSPFELQRKIILIGSVVRQSVKMLYYLSVVK